MFMEKDFSSQDIIEYFKQTRGIIKTRLRPYIDARNYVIAVLYQKFNFTEDNIGIIFNLNRSSVNHCKHWAYKLIVELNDSKYKRNVADLIEHFPFEFKSNQVIEEPGTTISIFNINADLYKKLIDVSKEAKETPSGYVSKLVLKHLENL